MAQELQSGWETLGQELTADLPSWPTVLRVLLRLLLALAFGGVLGWEREKAGKAAGLRTHMLVALGAATFVLCAFQSGMSAADLSRVIQGVATGIGFIGGGVILKMEEQERVRGVTTAAGIWMTAAAGVAAGAGALWAGAAGVALAWVILAVLSRLEEQLASHQKAHRGTR